MTSIPTVISYERNLMKSITYTDVNRTCEQGDTQQGRCLCERRSTCRKQKKNGLYGALSCMEETSSCSYGERSCLAERVVRSIRRIRMAPPSL